LNTSYENRIEPTVLETISAAEARALLPAQAAVAVSVVQGGAPAYLGAFGLRDRERGLRTTTTTGFQLGSLTKSMTASALLHAYGRRGLALDAPLRESKALRFEGATRNATLLDVLSHGTGVPGHDLLFLLGRYSTRELAARIARAAQIPGAFRKTVVYNNTLYACSGLLFDDLFDRTWDDYLGNELLRPLGISGIQLTGAAADDEARGYMAASPMAAMDVSAVAPAASARANIEDMARWALAQLGQKADVLPPELLERMQRAVLPADAMNPLLFGGLAWLGPPAYGLGWFVGSARGRKALFHMGLIDGFSSVMVLVPELALGISVVVNENLSAFPGVLAEHLFARMVGDEAPSVPTPPVAPDAPPAAAEVEPDAGVVGDYESDLYGRISVARSDTGLTLEYRGNTLPLRFDGRHEASIVVEAFGLKIPLPVSFAPGCASIPLSLDPRVPAERFTSVS